MSLRRLSCCWESWCLRHYLRIFKYCCVGSRPNQKDWGVFAKLLTTIKIKQLPVYVNRWQHGSQVWFCNSYSLKMQRVLRKNEVHTSGAPFLAPDYSGTVIAIKIEQSVYSLCLWFQTNRAVCLFFMSMVSNHRHIRKDRLINGLYCLPCLSLCAVSGLCKKAKNASEDVALVGAHNKT